MGLGTVVDASRRVADVPVRDLRNRTRDVMELVEHGWTVFLTSHGRRFAALTPVTDPVAAPRLAGLLAELDAEPVASSGLADAVAAQRDAERVMVGHSDHAWR